MKRLLMSAVLAAGLSVLAGTLPSSAASVPASTVPASASPAGATLADFYGQTLAWRSCSYGTAMCTRLRVPLDYANPGAGELALLVQRVRSTAPDRIGALVVNPGGPGVAGAQFAQYGDYLLGAVASRYDVVGFDPRGVGASSPIRCMSDRLTDAFLGADASPDTRAELHAYARVSARVAQSCVDRSPGLLAHIGTYDTARDLDVLRAALGETRLNYLGLSYGTRIGGVYADLFPDRVGRMILDGAVNPANTATQLVRGQARGFNDALRQFVRSCVATRCSIGDSRRQVTRRINALLSSLDEKPLQTGRRPLTQPLATNGILGSLYSNESGWTYLEAAIDSALDGDGRPLLDAADSFFRRSSDGTYESNLMSALNAISCWDGGRVPGAANLLRTAASDAQTSTFPEITTQLVMSALTCHYWPSRDDESPSTVSGPAQQPILVIGTRHDPATPWAWARQLADQLRSGVLLTWTGNGHTATGRGSDCVRRWSTAYLATGRPPADGTICR